jgi:hypothetical protein
VARKPDPLRQQLKLLEAAVKADKAERRTREKPLRDARRVLVRSLQSSLKSVDHYNQVIADKLHRKCLGCFCDSEKAAHAERSLANASALFKSRLVDLKTFDALHNVVAEDYPRLPKLDREATITAAQADRDARLAKIRAYNARASVEPVTSPSPENLT